MYTSADAEARKRTLAGYGAAALFCFLFQLIYESFSHGVTSGYMVYAFLIPVVGGALSFLSFQIFASRGGNLFRQFLCGSTIWLTLGSLIHGALEIYGTTNRLVAVFVIVGDLQLVAALASGICNQMKG